MGKRLLKLLAAALAVSLLLGLPFLQHSAYAQDGKDGGSDSAWGHSGVTGDGGVTDNGGADSSTTPDPGGKSIVEAVSSATPMDWVVTLGAFILAYFLGLGLTKLLISRMSPGSAGSFGCFLSTALFTCYVLFGLLMTMLNATVDTWLIWLLIILLIVMFVVVLIRKRGR